MNTRVIVDTVVDTSTSRINNIISPHHGKEIWVLKCLEKEIIVLPEYLKDQSLLEDIKNGSFNNKRYSFTIYKKGRYLVNAEGQ